MQERRALPSSSAWHLRRVSSRPGACALLLRREPGILFRLEPRSPPSSDTWMNRPRPNNRLQRTALRAAAEPAEVDTVFAVETAHGWRIESPALRLRVMESVARNRGDLIKSPLDSNETQPNRR